MIAPITMSHWSWTMGENLFGGRVRQLASAATLSFENPRDRDMLNQGGGVRGAIKAEDQGRKG